MVPVLVVILALVERQMLDQRLAVNPLAIGARPRNRLMRLDARRVDDIDRAARHVGNHDGAVGRLALNFRRARIGVAFRPGDAGAQQFCLQGRNHLAIFGMHQR